MQRVWYRKFDGCWYATFTEGSGQKQLNLIKGPKDKAHKKLAEEQLLKELKSRKPQSKKAAPDWLIINGVLRGFLHHSRKHHEPCTYRWYKDILKSFNRLFGRLRVTQLRKKHVSRWLEACTGDEMRIRLHTRNRAPEMYQQRSAKNPLRVESCKVSPDLLETFSQPHGATRSRTLGSLGGCRDYGVAKGVLPNC